MSNKLKHFMVNPRLDHPIPIETVDDAKTKFDIIRENIEILWERIKQLKLSIGETVNKNGSIPSSTIIQTSSGSTPPIIPSVVPLQRAKIALYDLIGNIPLSSLWNDLTFDSQDLIDGIFQHTPSTAEITVNSNGDFEVIVESGFKSKYSGQVCELRIVRDTGSGYQEIPGSRAYCTF